MLSINTNLSSLIVQSNLKSSTLGLNQAIERMTTGFKINGAKDNAAGYSISTNMSTKISAYQVAEDNASMGLDMLSTASSSLSLIDNALSRLRSLSVQASNGTYGSASLAAINSEANSLVDEINRLYSTAEYNCQKLFSNVSEESSGFITAITKRDTSAMTSLSSVDSSAAISSGTYSISSAEELAKLAEMTNNGLITGGEFVLANDIDLGAYSNWTPIGTIDMNTHDIQFFSGIFDGNGYTISNLTSNQPDGAGALFGSASNAEIKNLGLENVDVSGGYACGLLGYAMSATISNCYATGSVVGVDSGIGGALAAGLVGAAQNLSITDSYSTAAVSATSNNQTTAGGLIAILVDTSSMTNCYSSGSVIVNGSGGKAQLYAGGIIGGTDSFTTVTITNSYATGNVSSNSSGGASVVAGAFCGSLRGTATISSCYYDTQTTGQSAAVGQNSSTGNLDITGVTTSELNNLITTGMLPKNSSYTIMSSNIVGLQVGIDSSESSRLTLDLSFSLSGIEELRNIGLNNNDYVSRIDELITSISAKQTEYGAAQNRLESALEQIGVAYDNLVSSRSTIRDADIAEESSEYIKMQILQQASATLLATANQTPSIALQLL